MKTRYTSVSLSWKTHQSAKIPSSEKNISTSLLAQAGLPPTSSGKRMYVPLTISNELSTVIHVILNVGDQVG